ncbi:MAG TPA: CPBP family intramembrane glutamic endopeptidase [Pyrinomonadaceae bacterium]|nr:CPBP family intramembrane glutamic endopeptidase [Pyrinomonadaceae bacterium]
MAFINGVAGYIVYSAISAGQQVEAVQHGKIVVIGNYFIDKIREVENAESPAEKRVAEERLENAYDNEAQARSHELGGTREANDSLLRKAVQTHPSSDFITQQALQSETEPLKSTRSLPAMIASLALIWWLIMMIFQGEGLELDLERRRYPMWEWVFSHPVKPGAVFLAEMLAPIAANPTYATGPFFFGVLYGFIYSPEVGIAAAILIGVPVSVAAACAGKALEIGVMLRFPARSRGAVIGFMSWLGYAAMVSFLLATYALPRIVGALGAMLRPLATSIPWPVFSWATGLQSDGSLSFISGMIVCWLASVFLIAGGVSFTIWGAQRGLISSSAKAKRPAVKKFARKPRFRKDPLYRKEMLWFLRDRGAIVQVVLIPLTVASVELFNFRWFAKEVENSWPYLSGAALLFGTYFLWILGPRSLASEGQALWLALTWPRGLEALMKAKARLWFLIATALVMLVFAFAMFRFPHDAWKVVLVAIGWLAFGRSMAEKSVTLVSASSSSGEPEPVPKGRRWAASLGTFTFAIGVVTLQWQIAVIGIVYSWVTAAAMWQNFRARLPFLFDPWSEKVPPPPTLLHAMIAISVLMEGGTVLTGFFIIFVSSIGNVAAIAVAQVLAYGSVAVVVSVVVSVMLTNRGLPPKEVWCWRTQSTPDQTKPWWWSGDGTRGRRFFISISLGVMGGLLLGLLALGYVSLLSRVPTFYEMFRVVQEQREKFPSLKLSYAVMAIGFAPFAEEYLFRGLLFRSLDREWGGWRALVGSAAFFAIYHPPLAWLPVGLLGVTNALLFKKTGRLAPAVILHIIYNVVVLS